MATKKFKGYWIIKNGAGEYQLNSIQIQRKMCIKEFVKQTTIK